MEKIKLISHRGNIEAPNPSLENHPSQIDFCIKEGFDVEIDIRLIDNIFYLGHDEPQYKVDFEWLLLRARSLWIHCKNLEALEFLSSYKEFNIFWHQEDDFTLTSKKFIWTYPNKNLGKKSVAVLPEIWYNYSIEQIKDLNCYGICSDEIGIIGEILK